MSASAGRRPDLSAVFRFEPLAAALPLPAMALALGGGLAAGQAVTGSILAGSAFSVGFGASREIGGRRWAVMPLTAAAMTVAAFSGTLLGRWPGADLAVLALAGGASGALATRDGTFWWIWLQATIAFMVAAYYPGDAAAAAHRALLVAGGGALQCALTLAAMRVLGAPALLVPTPASPAPPRETALHALRGALCVSGALAAGQALGLAHVYWAPMTALIVLKPGLRDTGGRGLERIGGTVVGVVLATGLATLLAGETWLLAAVATLAAGAAFGLQRARYAVLTSALTVTALMLTVIGGSPVLSADLDRLTATLLGGAVALLGAGIAPRRLPWRRTAEDRV